MKTLKLSSFALIIITLATLSCSKTAKTTRNVSGTWYLESYRKDSNFYNEDDKKPIAELTHELIGKSLSNDRTFYNDTFILKSPGTTGTVDSCTIKFNRDGTFAYRAKVHFVKLKVAAYQDVIIQHIIYSGNYKVVNDSIFLKAKHGTFTKYIVRDGDTIVTDNSFSDTELPLFIAGRFKIDELSKDNLVVLTQRHYNLIITSRNDSSTIKCSKHTTAIYHWIKE